MWKTSDNIEKLLKIKNVKSIWVYGRSLTNRPTLAKRGQFILTP